MNEKGLRPYNWTGLSYNEWRNVVPQRKQQWDGEEFQELELKKPNQHFVKTKDGGVSWDNKAGGNSDYSDMIYTSDLRCMQKPYPTSRYEKNLPEFGYKPWTPPEVEIPEPEPEPEPPVVGHWDECTSLTGWTAVQVKGGVISQVTFDGCSTFKFDASAGADSRTLLYKTSPITFGDPPTRMIFEVRMYIDVTGGIGDNPTSVPIIQLPYQAIHFASEGLYFLTDSSGFSEVGTDLVVEDVWQKWKFDVDFSSEGYPCDVYLDDVLKASGVDSLRTTGGSAIYIILGRLGLAYIDYLDFTITE